MTRTPVPSMALRAGLGFVRQQWRWTLIVTLLATATGAIVVWRQAPRYTAQVSLFLSVSRSPVEAEPYRELLRDDRVMRAVIDELHLDTTPARLAGGIKTSAKSDRELAVTADGPSAAQAHDVANSVASQFVRLLPALTSGPGGRRPALRTVTIRPAGARLTRVTPQPVRDLAASMVLGLVLGLTSAAARVQLDTTRSTDHTYREPTVLPPLPLPSQRPVQAPVARGVARVVAIDERTR